MKNIIFLSFLIFVSSSIFGQVKVELGLKGGLNLASLSTDSKSVDFSNKTGYHFGAYGLVKVAMFGVQPELLYSTRGATVSAKGVSQSFSQDYTYMDIPVMFKLYTVAGLNFQVGPQFGMLLSTSGKNVDGTDIKKSDFKDSDLSAAIGAGWDAPFGLNLTARYILGLSDVASAVSGKNRTFQVSLGYKLIRVGR